MKSEISAAKQLHSFLSRFSPRIVAQAKAARAKLRKRLPGAVEMVYDNFNALVIGYSPTERPSDAIVSLGLYPRWINLYFLQGAHLPDPERLLQGSGSQVRFIRLEAGAAMLDTPAVLTLLSEAIAFGEEPFAGSGRLVIRAISKKQRSRR